MKSRKFLLMLAVALSVVVPIRVSASDITEETHKHQYSSQVTTQPTKTSYGIRTYTCKCGDSYEKAIDPYKLDKPKYKDYKVGDGTVSFTIYGLDDETTHVTVRRATNHDASVEVATLTKDQLQFVDTNVKAGDLYTYYIKAVGEVSSSDVCSTGMYYYLDIPQLSYTHDEKGIHLTWTPVEGAKEYTLQKKVNDSWKTISTGAGCSYTDTTYIHGEECTYRVHASKFSEIYKASECTVQSMMFGTPSEISVVNDSYKRLRVQWKKAAGAEGYIVYRSTTEDGEYTEVKRYTSSANTSYYDSNLKLDQTYYYKVAAYAGDEMHWCEEIGVGTPKMKSPQMQNVHYCTSSSITVKWDSVDKADGYYVYRKTVSGSWKKIATVKKTGSDTYSYKDKNAKGTYYYAICSYKEENGKKCASEKSEPLLMATLTTPKIKSISQVGSTNKVKITWNKIKNAGEYRIYRKKGSKGSWEFYESTESDQTSFIASLEPGKIYYWKVQAVMVQDEKVYIIGAKSDSKKYSFSAPKFSYDVITSTSRKNLKGLIKIKIKNHGSQSLRFYSADAFYYHDEDSSYDRELRLVTSGGKKLTSSTISKSKTLYYDVVGDKTMFTNDSVISLVFKYDGIYYLFCVSGDGTVSSTYYFEE